MRILYKSQKNLLYNDYLLTKVVTFCPLHFDDKMITLAKVFDNIILKEEYHKFYHGVQIWEKNIDSLKEIYIQKKADISEFFLDKELNKKFRLICLLGQSF